METYLQLTAVWGVYLGLATFVLGMAWRASVWLRTPRSPIPLGLYPKPSSGAGRFGKLMTDTFVAPRSAAQTPVMWSFAMAFHLAALAAFVGHLRLVREFGPLVSALGEDGMNAFAAWSGGAAGLIMLAAVLFWIARRTYGKYRQLSSPEDYLLLFLLLGIVVMGDHMRFLGEVHAPVYREWFASLLAFRPHIPGEILGSNVGWSLGTHMLFTDLFLAYFPFSKLVHAIGAFATNSVRSA